MPEQDPLTIPIPGEGVTTMITGDGTLFAGLMEQNMAALGQVATLINVNMQRIDKAFDYSYLEGKELVSLTEAMGAREVASEVNPGGPRKPS